MSHGWEGRTALVTGASRGIGAALAQTLASRSANLVLSARDRDELERVASSCREAGAAQVTVVVADLLDDELAPALVDAIGELRGLDVLANVAGSAIGSAPLEDLRDEDWTANLNLNLLSAVRLQQRCFPALRAARGVVLNVGSVVASRAAVRGAAYAAAKAGLASLTRSTAIEWARHGVRAVCIEPGFVDTDFNRDLKAAGLEERLLAKVPTGRAITAASVAELLVAVSSADLQDLTGTVITMDGGWSAKL